jgi:hypothetical protein
MIIKFAKAQDVKKGIERALFEKQQSHTSETYTAIKFDDGRSIKIEKESPEEAMKCVLRETKYNYVDVIYLYGD